MLATPVLGAALLAGCEGGGGNTAQPVQENEATKQKMQDMMSNMKGNMKTPGSKSQNADSK